MLKINTLSIMGLNHGVVTTMKNNQLWQTEYIQLTAAAGDVFV